MSTKRKKAKAKAEPRQNVPKMGFERRSVYGLREDFMEEVHRLETATIKGFADGLKNIK